MSDLLSTSVVILSEVTLMLGVVIAVFLILRARRLKRERAMVNALIARLREHEPTRKEQLLQMLRESCGFDESRSQEVMEAMNKNEKTLYRGAIRMFLGRERGNIRHMDRDVNTLVQAYVNLIQGDGEADHEGSGGTSVLSFTAIRKENESLKDETGQLKEEINRLRQELADAKRASENMMKEFATMFAGGQREGEMKVRDEMEKLKERNWAHAEENEPVETQNVTESNSQSVIKEEEDVPEFDAEPPAEDSGKQAS